MMPSARTTRLIGGIIARYQEKFGIEIYAYVVLSNHIHLIVRAPQSNVDNFMQNVNREISRRVNWIFHREGPLWARRYDDLEILTESDLLEAFLYVNTNPSRHGLIENSKNWPGLNSYQHSLSQRDRPFTFHHYSADDPKRRVTKHYLKLSILPQFQGLSRKGLKERVASLLKERTNSIIQSRVREGGGFLGLKGLEDQHAGERPLNSACSPRPSCYSKCAKRIKEFKKKAS